MLTGQKSLAKTSATPGKTQLINHFEVVSAATEKGGREKQLKWFLVDLPGYGYATVSHKARNNWGNMIESYIRKRENLVSLFVLIDSRHSPQPIDLDFVNQLGSWGIPFSVVFTKSDKNKPGATVRNVNAFLSAMKEHWEQLPPVFTTSAVKREGREDILQYIESLNISFTKP